MDCENKDRNIEQIEQILSERIGTNHGIAYDIVECIKDIPTMELAQYCIHKFGEGLIRDYLENQIISDEIHKEKTKNYEKYAIEYEDEFSL